MPARTSTRSTCLLRRRRCWPRLSSRPVHTGSGSEEEKLKGVRDFAGRLFRPSSPERRHNNTKPKKPATHTKHKTQNPGEHQPFNRKEPGDAQELLQDEEHVNGKIGKGIHGNKRPVYRLRSLSWSQTSRYICTKRVRWGLGVISPRS